MYKILGVNFQEFFLKNLRPKKQQNGKRKTLGKTTSCSRMTSTGNYNNLFVHTAKLNVLKFQIVISYNSQHFSFYMQKIHK